MNPRQNQQQNQQQQQQQQQQQPEYKQLAVGSGIDQQEFNSILNCCKQVYMQRLAPYSTNAANAIKKAMKGDWFVLVSAAGNKDFDFSLTSVTGGDFLTFSLDNAVFHICRLKE